MRRLWCFGLALVLFLSLATPALGQGPVVHIVQRGENLFRIALRYGVTVNALATANRLSDPRLIYVGQRLIIPAPTAVRPAGSTTASSARVHVVVRGENLYRIALRYGVTVQAIASANGIVNANRIYAGQRLAIPGVATGPSPLVVSTTSAQTYTVRRGDTLSAIALRYSVSVWALVQANDIRNPSLIYPGQVLRIPSSASPAVDVAAMASLSTGDPSGRWIDIDLSAQRLTAYQGNTAVRSTLVSTGLPRTPTPVGQFRIYAKYDSASMSGPGYHYANVPHVMYFYRSYSMHGAFWHSNFGRQMSHGCVNLPPSEAQWLYGWARVGTLVKIHY